MKSVIKFRLYPSKSQKRELFRQFGKHCELYNYCRDERIKTYELTKSSPSCIDQIKANVPKFKDRTNVSSLQQTVRRVDKAFRNFFRRVKRGQAGFPRYKKSLNSIEFTAGDGVSMKSGKLYIQHVGKIKTVVHRKLPKFSRVIIKYSNRDFYVSFMVDADIKALEPSDKNIGLDFGLKTFITTSDGESIESPKFLKKNLGRLSKAASKRDKLTKGSKERKAKSHIIQKIFKKVSNQRSDFNHKLSNRIIRENGTVVIEDLDIKKLSSGVISNVNRTYNDVSWGQFTQMLSYKAASAGRKFIKVNPINTSKTCSSCGKIHELTLEDRIMNCSCGYTENRDVNAAKNILRLGLQSLALADSKSALT